MGQEPRFTMPASLLELRDALELTWPERMSALRASGVPLNADGDDDTADDDVVNDDKSDADDDKDKKPPWGDDDKDFDADKAKRLITNLRDDAGKAKRERDDLAKKVKAHEDSTKSDREKIEERAADAEKRATAAETELVRAQVALEKGLTPGQAKRLVGTTKEELLADADELLSEFKTDGSDQGSRRRPKEQLRPGAAPSSSDDDETDPAKLAAQVPRQY